MFRWLRLQPVSELEQVCKRKGVPVTRHLTLTLALYGEEA